VWNYNIKIIVYSKEEFKKKITLSFVEYTWHILETNVTFKKNRFQMILTFRRVYLKPTFTILNLKVNS